MSTCCFVPDPKACRDTHSKRPHLSVVSLLKNRVLLYCLTSFSPPPDFDPSRFAGYLSVPRCVVSSSAEKRNYELFFEACQLGFSCRYTALVTVARIKPPSGPTDSPCQVAPASFAQMMRPQPNKSKKCSLPHRLELPFWV